MEKEIRSSLPFRCIECGNTVGSLYQEFSWGNIKLTRCEVCHAYADEYMEHEMMVIWIDLVLHKERAYRHLLFNVLPQQRQRLKGLLWKTTTAVLVLDAGRHWLCDHPSEALFDDPFWPTVFSFFQYLLAAAVLGHPLYLLLLLLLVRQQGLSREHRWTEVVRAVQLASFCKLVTVPMLVWRFERAVVLLVDLFVLTSNVTALKVLLETSFSQAGALVITAALVQAVFVQLAVTCLGLWRDK